MAGEAYRRLAVRFRHPDEGNHARPLSASLLDMCSARTMTGFTGSLVRRAPGYYFFGMYGFKIAIETVFVAGFTGFGTDKNIDSSSIPQMGHTAST